MSVIRFCIFKQKTAYEMRISDWSSDVCSSDLATAGGGMVFDGFAMRWIRDYDPNYLRDRSVVSSFAGAASVNDGPDVDIDGAGPDPAVPTNQRAVKFNFTAA